MSFEFFPDNRLYTDRSYCLANFLPPADQAPVGRLLYHCFWTGEITRHHQICLNSLRLAASQPAEIWLWMKGPDLTQNRDRIPEGVKTRLLLPDMEIDGTSLAGRLDLFTGGAAAVSDAFRWLVLKKWGGFYFDMDMLFLRDPRPLAAYDFVYQWSDQRYGNSALAHMRPGASIAQEMHERVCAFGTAHPKVVLDFARPPVAPLHVLPVFLVDPLWVQKDREDPGVLRAIFEDRAPTSLAAFWPGAYTYHWHNQWGRPIPGASQMGQLAHEIDSKLRAA
jgi:hypothetical protein